MDRGQRARECWCSPQATRCSSWPECQRARRWGTWSQSADRDQPSQKLLVKQVFSTATKATKQNFRGRRHLPIQQHGAFRPERLPAYGLMLLRPCFARQQALSKVCDMEGSNAQTAQNENAPGARANTPLGRSGRNDLIAYANGGDSVDASDSLALLPLRVESLPNSSTDLRIVPFERSAAPRGRRRYPIVDWVEGYVIAPVSRTRLRSSGRAQTCSRARCSTARRRRCRRRAASSATPPSRPPARR